MSTQNQEVEESENRFDVQMEEILDSCSIHLSNLKPSEWYEQNMVMPLGSAFPGPYRYKKTPYLKEIIDCLSKDHPAHTVAVMKGAQIGVSAGVLTPGVGYIIAEQPGNTLFLTGHSELSDEAISKIDMMIDNCGIRDLIRPTVMRKKNQKTGDTNKSKEFAGGTLVSGSATNHNLLRQRDIMYAFVDDFDAAKKSSKEAGSTTTLIEQRTAAFEMKRKIYYVSTPQLKYESNIEDVYELGDQRKYHTPCPCCGEYIVWYWETVSDINEKEKAGITYKLDDNNELIADSVGYICQKCGGFFDDRDKQNLLSLGKWIPTSKPSQPGYYSYHISALYAPPGMFGWEYYVRKYLAAFNEDGEENIREMQAFVNVVLGETYEEKSVENKATELQKNQRKYEIGVIPESLSIKDGNGQIVLLTLAADLNGKLDDARLDYEVVAWSESGSSYSVEHGSIGTFVPREGQNGADRERWTYRFQSDKSVWGRLQEILSKKYKTDTGRNMMIFISGIDAGYLSEYVYPFVDNSNKYTLALKGDVSGKYSPYERDVRTFKQSKERGNMYILESNHVKDELSSLMKLVWNPQIQDKQPAGFMNFPESNGGLYQFTNYFSHFEAERRVTHTNASGDPVGTRWEKKDSIVQNHLFDCRCYNIAIKDILVHNVCKEMKIPNGTWKDYVDIVLGKIK